MKFIAPALACASLLIATGCAAPQRYHHAAVATDHIVASEAGLEMLRRGGNAVDAAVAASFALSVVRPYSCGIGGGGFMVIHIPADDQLPSQSIALNYREVAPSAIAPEYYLSRSEHASRFGGAAVGVPGTVAGLLHALEKHGTLDRATVLAPAIRAAENGVPADANYVAAARHLAQMFRQHPDRTILAGGIWTDLCLNGRVREGDIIRQPAKARALRLIADHGAEVFYQGEIADAIIAAVQRHGGEMTRDDLAGFALITAEPLRASALGHELLAMPPPSSGGIALVQIFGIFDRRFEDHARPNHNGPAYLHLLAEAMKHAFADRAEWLADPAFADVPMQRLISPSYLDDLAGRVRSDAVLDDRFHYGTVTPGGTSHLSVIDASGMAVACTETVNLIYGSLVYVPEFGIVLNNQMDDFTTDPDAPNAFGLRQSLRNVPEPGKRPLSSMSPTIVLKDGRAVAIAGASGGPRIISATAQALLNSLLFDMDAQQAVASPRVHHQWLPDSLYVEPPLAALEDALGEFGHNVTHMEDIGVVQFIRVHADGTITAASDPRKGGRPAGY